MKAFDEQTCTVCKSPAYSAALCIAHYHIRYGHLSTWDKMQRKVIARQLRGIRMASKVAYLMQRELEGKAYFATPLERLIIAVTPDDEKKRLIIAAAECQRKTKELKGDL